MIWTIIITLIAIYVIGWVISAIVGTELWPSATLRQAVIATFMWPLWWPTTAIAVLLSIDHIIPRTLGIMGKKAAQAILRRLT